MLDDNTLSRIEETRSKHEFLTFLIMDNEIKVGIIQNETLKFVMLFDFEKIRDEGAKKRFLEHADEWWWGSNQSVPINSFIGEPFDEFQHALTGYPKKIIKQTIGPTFSLAEKYLKRVKKKRIEIINRNIPQSVS